MAEIITEPRREHVVHHYDDANAGRSSGLSTILAVVLLVVLALLFIYYGLPYLSRATTPQVSVPERVNVNVNGDAQ
jgi:hypothetical protein